MDAQLSSQITSITKDDEVTEAGGDNKAWKPKGSKSTLVVSLTPNPAEKPDVLEFNPANPDDSFPANINKLRATVQTKNNPQAQKQPYSSTPGDTSSAEVRSKYFNVILIQLSATHNPTVHVCANPLCPILYLFRHFPSIYRHAGTCADLGWTNTEDRRVQTYGTGDRNPRHVHQHSTEHASSQTCH